MELKATEHSYYCNDGNYYSSNSLSVYETWDDFKSSWLNANLKIDHDYNHCFRYDIKPLFDYELDKDHDDRFSLHLYMMLQRKGNFVPVTVKEITEDDMPEIEKYLSDCWEYMKGQWKEFSDENIQN
ncbi:hypothetical protein [Bacillus atrophaeus]|uniref:hypothetical protein n=1 Tax=Bacillus atrophaeus TaxID=1452 RepID=UPI002E1B86E3|nr:hypothetical protein [Bacillus atrophaeus]